MINKLGPIHSDERKRKMDAIVARNASQNRITQDIRNKEKIGKVTTNDRKTFDDGVKWFESGLSLNEAPDKLKNSPNFIAGFENGKRTQYVNQLAYDTGIEYFKKGIKLEQIPENYRNNEFFMSGYNSNNSKSR